MFEKIKQKVYQLYPDNIYLKKMYKYVMGKDLDLKNPKTFNEKLQWLKLYDRNPLYTILCDKYEVKKYLINEIDEKYIIPTIGIYDSFDDINFEKLPKKFVMKCTHDSGGVYVCKDKERIDIKELKEYFESRLKVNFYTIAKEWPYKNVKPRIIIEELLIDKNNLDGSLTDYKFYCFNGYVDCVMACYERETGKPKFYFFDKNWNLKRINIAGKQAPNDFSKPKPTDLNEMIQLSEKLSKGIPFVRVDLYNINNKVYFGEMTFYPQSGFDPNYLPETDEYFGKLIDISLAYKNTSNKKY